MRFPRPEAEVSAFAEKRAQVPVHNSLRFKRLRMALSLRRGLEEKDEHHDRNRNCHGCLPPAKGTQRNYNKHTHVDTDSAEHPE
jgi:hypothetical protein